MADDFLGVLIQDNDQIVPTPGANLDFGHICTPDSIGIGRFWLGTARFSFGLVSGCLSNQKAIFLHQAIDTFLVDCNTLPVIEVSPTTAVTPEGMLSLHRLNER